jgi:hypothetical protein
VATPSARTDGEVRDGTASGAHAAAETRRPIYRLSPIAASGWFAPRPTAAVDDLRQRLVLLRERLHRVVEHCLDLPSRAAATLTHTASRAPAGPARRYATAWA